MILLINAVTQLVELLKWNLLVLRIKHIDFLKKVKDKDSKFEVGDRVRIWKYKNIFPEGYTPNWSEEVSVVSKIKNTVLWTYVVNELNDEEIIGTFYEK